MLVDLVGLGFEFVSSNSAKNLVQSFLCFSEKLESSSKHNRVDNAVIPSRCRKTHRDFLREDVLAAKIMLNFGAVVFGFFTDFVVFGNPKETGLGGVAETAGNEEDTLDLFFKKYQSGFLLGGYDGVWIRTV